MSAHHFDADCYAIKNDGCPMPCRLLGLDQQGRAEVVAPNGLTYTFPPEHLVDLDEGREILHANRVAHVASYYAFRVILRTANSLVVRCWNPAHPKKSDYVMVMTRFGKTCSCPAFVKNPEEPCKHLEAIELLAEEKKDAIGWAVKIESPRAAPAPKPEILVTPAAAAGYYASPFSKPVLTSDDW